MKRVSAMARILVPVLLLAGALIVAPVGTDVAGASTYFTSQTFNMAAGNAAYDAIPGQETNAMNAVLWNVNANDPWTFALQEVCSNTFDTIRASLPNYRARYDAVVPYHSHCHDTTATRGNAVFTIGTQLDSWQYALTHQSPDDTSNQETRRLSCIKAQNIGFVFWGCSTHISDEVGYAEYQAESALNLMNFLTSWAVVGGDFNQVPNSDPPGGPPNATAAWYWGYQEMHNMNGSYWTTTGNKKFDYVWAGRSYAALYTAPSTACAFVYDSSGNRLSDHKYCKAGFLYS